MNLGCAVPGGLVATAHQVVVDLCEELSAMQNVLTRAADSKETPTRLADIGNEVHSCAQNSGTTAQPPDVTELKRLHKQVFKERMILMDAEHQTRKANKHIEEFERVHGAALDQADDNERDQLHTSWQAALQHEQTCRRVVRTTTHRLDKEMRTLTGKGAKHWPEVFNMERSLTQFKDMDGLCTVGLNLSAYEDRKALPEQGRNSVYTATITDQNGQQRPCVLKQYNLTGTSVPTVEKEVQLLHKIKHANIVAVEAIFLDGNDGIDSLYVQMPKYEDDLKRWLLKERPIPPALELRKIVLGILRAVARVHEFEQTHNDIKLDQGESANPVCTTEY